MDKKLLPSRLQSNQIIIQPRNNNVQKVCRQPKYNLESHNLKTENQTCVLCYFDENQQLVIDEQGLKFLIELGTTQIGIFGLIGQKQMINQLFENLFQVNYYQDKLISTNSKMNEYLKIHKSTISASNNKKIIFIEICGEISLELSQKMLEIYEILMILCSDLIVLSKSINNHEVFNMNNLKAIIEKIIKQNNSVGLQIDYLPNQLYYLTEKLESSKGEAGLSEYFKKLTISHFQLTPTYLLQLISQFSQSNQKQIQGLQLNSRIVCKLLMKFISRINSRKRNQDSIVIQVIQDLYDECLEFLKIFYDERLMNYFQDENAKTQDYLLDSFKQCSLACLKEYQKFSFYKPLKDSYCEQIENYIDQKERLILQINKKKSHFEIKKRISSLNLKQNEIKTIQNFKDIHQQFSHSQPQLFQQILSTLMQRNLKIKKKQRQNQIKNIIQNLKQMINAKRLQLSQYQQQNQNLFKQKMQIQKLVKKLKDNEQNLSHHILKLKKDIEFQRNVIKDCVLKKHQAEAKGQQLLAEIRKLEEKQRQNIQNCIQIQRYYDFHQETEILKRKLKEKQAQVRQLMDLADKYETQSKKVRQIESRFIRIQSQKQLGSAITK